MFSRFFIDRPVFAIVISIVICIAGLVSMRALPIAQYPDIIPPDVVVVANYPGASADVIATTVAAPLEQQINGAENMIYMRSASASSGQMTITVTFNIGTNPDLATIDVNNRVQSALSRLPEEVRRQGVTVRKRASAILQVVTMFSPNGRYDPIFISNYALLNVIDELKRVQGVGDATLFGAKDYSMRIWLKPDRLAQYGLTPADVSTAIQEQNSQFAAGQFGQEPLKNKLDFTYTVTTQGRFANPKEFENIILRGDPNTGATLRLKDVARVELGAQDYSFAASFDGKPSIGIGLYLQPGANALDTVQRVNAKMAELSKTFPEGVAYASPFNTTRFVDVSINEVIHTFAEALILVVLVVFLFLQDVRATLIPLVAVPVSLIGTFAGMYVLGFSINLLTLFGMVLAIGIVVDDAIVVLENVERLMRERKMSAHDAAVEAMNEVTGPIIAIVLVLCAVFVPVGFMGGLTGVMYKQFAITIAVSVVISGIVALTLSPALCALLLKPHVHKPNRFFDTFNRWFDNVTTRYVGGVRGLIGRGGLALVLTLIMLAACGLIYSRIATGLVPEEDQGYIFTMDILPPGASLSRTQAVTDEMTRRFLAQPQTQHVVTFAGIDFLSSSNKTNSGVSFVILKPWDERPGVANSAQSFVGKTFGMGANIKDALVLAFNPPPITGMSTTGGFEFYLQNRSGASLQEVSAMADKLVAAAAKRPELAGVQANISANVPQYYVDLDRAKARSLNVPINSIFAAMQATFGSFYVNDFTLYGRTFRVSLQSESEFREKPEDLRYVYVRATNGKMIPLDTLIHVRRIVGPDIVERFNVFTAGKIMGGPAPGFSSGQAIATMEEVAKQVLPMDYSVGWIGPAYQEKIASGKGAQSFMFGILMVFLILSAQYGRWSLPIAVLAAVPFGVFGALLATWMRDLNNDVYFQVGLLTLIGLSAKNAILIVEFAVLERKEGKSLKDAAIEAARLRFRPIVMTSMAFVLGCVPLAISSGAGSASRHAIGTGVIGGMLTATFLAIFFVPLYYILVSKLAERGEKRTGIRAPAHRTRTEGNPHA